MDPHQRWCHNHHCRAYGRVGEGHVVIHSQKERRYRCKRCGRTFSETKDTALYRMHKPQWLVLAVLTLLSYGCPLQAIVAAFGLDERTPSPALAKRVRLAVQMGPRAPRRGREGTATTGAGRRNQDQGGRRDLLVGFRP